MQYLRTILLATVLMFGFAATTAAQSADEEPPAELPAFSFFKVHSGGFGANPVFSNNDLPSGKATVVMLFDPYCDHCQQQTEEFTQAAGKLKNIHFVYVTTESAEAASEFESKYLKNSGLSYTLLRDKNYQFDSIFSYSPVPSVYLYSANGRLLKYYKTDKAPVDELVGAL